MKITRQLTAAALLAGLVNLGIAVWRSWCDACDVDLGDA